MADGARPPVQEHNRRVHMANERTFLAWIRTSIGLMAFGFVVERFALFVKQLSHFLGSLPEGAVPAQPSRGYASAIGIFLVALGIVTGMLSYVRYRRMVRQIEDDAYVPSSSLVTFLALSVLIIGILLIAYLIHSL